MAKRHRGGIFSRCTRCTLNRWPGLRAQRCAQRILLSPDDLGVDELRAQGNLKAHLPSFNIQTLGTESRISASRTIFLSSSVLVFFVLGLMSKPMLVTMPFVLLLLDYWPLGRISSVRALLALALEKVPFLVLSALSSVITMNVQARTVAGLQSLPLDFRLENVLASYLLYLKKLLLPFGLVPFYPFPAEHPLGIACVSGANRCGGHHRGGCFVGSEPLTCWSAGFGTLECWCPLLAWSRWAVNRWRIGTPICPSIGLFIGSLLGIERCGQFGMRVGRVRPTSASRRCVGQHGCRCLDSLHSAYCGPGAPVER
jgi:hypothetical protein